MLKLGERGRIVIPAQVRKKLGWKPGERLAVVVMEDNSLKLISSWDVARNTQGMFKHIAPGRSLADELIAERRAEAVRDEAEATRDEAERE